MGCDIHIIIQRHESSGWIHIPHWIRPETLDQRNYNLFGILGDVRNEAWPSIAPHRGLPDDYREDHGAWLRERG